MRARRSGFTLLEVLVAVSILGLGLTVILSSQAGLFASTSHSENLTHAGHLARCRMAETEVELAKNGFPLIDQNDEGPCCEGEDEPRYRCSWKIERIELPQPAAFAGGDGGLTDQGGLGQLAALAGGDPNAPAPSLDGGLGGLASLVSGAAAGGDGIATMAMGMVYPTLKSMLEASIRKTTITVHWKEGVNDRELSITQYITNPQQGGLDPSAAQGLDQLDGLFQNQGTQGAGTSPSGSETQK